MRNQLPDTFGTTSFCPGRISEPLILLTLRMAATELPLRLAMLSSVSPFFTMWVVTRDLGLAATEREVGRDALLFEADEDGFGW